MRATIDDVLVFWMTPWSKPLRDLSVQLTFMDPPISGKKPDEAAPKWLRPLCLQRWVARAIAARLAWMSQHPECAPYRFGRESEPCWEAPAWASYDWRCLRALSEATLLWIFGMEVERLLRIMQEPPSLEGGVDWTKATPGASEHIIQVYRELKRRQPASKGQGRALRARGILREALRRFGAGEDDGTVA
jgi:hypothetical protein